MAKTVSHTPEPWFYNQDEGGYQGHNINIANGMIAEVCEGDSWNDLFENLTQAEADALTAANARRIVACVNACAGIPLDVVQGMCVKAMIEHEVRQTERADKDEVTLDAARKLAQCCNALGEKMLAKDNGINFASFLPEWTFFLGALKAFEEASNG